MKKSKTFKSIIAVCLCLCLGIFSEGQPFAVIGSEVNSNKYNAVEEPNSSFGEGLSDRLYNMSSRYDGSRSQSYGGDTIISNTDSGLPNAPVLGNGNVGVIAGGSSVGQSINVGMNDFWQGTYNPSNMSGTAPLPVGSVGYSIVDSANPYASDVDLATKYSLVTASATTGSGPAVAVSGDYVSTARNGFYWQSAWNGDNSWLQLQFAEPITFSRFALWNASSCMYNAASGNDLTSLALNGHQYWNTHAFSVQTSNNGRDWTTVYALSNNYQAIVERDIPVQNRAAATNVTYVRLYINDASSSPRGNVEPARVCKFSLFEHPKNDPNLMPGLVNGAGTLITGGAPSGSKPVGGDHPIQVTSNASEIGDGGHIYTSSDLYLTVSGNVQHLAGYGTQGCGWFTDTSPTGDSITYGLSSATTFKSYQLYNGSSTAPSFYGRGDWRAWHVETSQDGGNSWNEVHRVNAPTDPSAPNWGGQPMISSFDIAGDKLQYTTNVNKIRLTIDSVFGSRALMSQFKIFAGTLEESGINLNNRAMFYQNIRDGRIGVEANYNSQSYKADTLMSQEESLGKNYIVTKFTNNSSSPMTFRYYTFAHRYDNPGYCQDANVTADGKTLYSTQTTRTADNLDNLAWLSAATIAASLEGGASWINSGKGVGTAYGDFIVPANSSVSVVANVDGREYFPEYTGMPYQNINALNSPTKQTAIDLSKSQTAQNITAQSDEWWKAFWLKSYVDISTADAGAEKYYYFAQYIVGCGTREDNVPMSLFGPWITSNTPAWAGCYTTDYNTYGPYMAVAGSNRADLLKPLVRNTLESWGGSGLGNGIGRTYAQKINYLHGLNKFKDKDGNWLFKNGADGVMSGVRSSPHGYCYDNAGFYGIQFTSAYAAVPVLSYFDMTQGTDPMLTLEIEYEYLKDMMILWEQLLFYEDGVYQLKYDAAWEDEQNQTANSFTLAALHRFSSRLVEDASKLGITVEEEPRIAKWADIDANLVAYPSAMTRGHDGNTRFSFSDTQESANQGFVTVKGLNYNNPNVVSAQVFPVGNLGLYSDPVAKQKMTNSLTTIKAWGQMNAHPTIFSTAARIGYSEYNEDTDMVGFDSREVKTLLDQYSKTCQGNMAQNNISGLFDPLQLIDTCGGAQGLNDMLVQMSDGIITFFPAFPKDKDAKFVNLQLTGGVLVSAEYDGETKKVLNAKISPKFDKRINVAIPRGVKWKIVDANNAEVTTKLSTVGTLLGRDAYNSVATISFNGVAGETYKIVEA